jgi:hypothetical protein
MFNVVIPAKAGIQEKIKMKKRLRKKKFKKWERNMVASICRSMENSCQKTAEYFQRIISEAKAVPEMKKFYR